MLPFGAELFKYLPDPFDFDKIGFVAKRIITERTKANGGNQAHVSYRQKTFQLKEFLAGSD